MTFRKHFNGDIRQLGIMKKIGILFVYIHYAVGTSGSTGTTTSSPDLCGPPVEIGNDFQLSDTFYNASGTLTWVLDYTRDGEVLLDCFHNGTCVSDFEPDLQARIDPQPTGNDLFTYNVTLSMTNLNPPNDIITGVAWILNDTLLGRCDLQVFSFYSRMACLDLEVELDEPGSKVTWKCSMAEIFPKAICQVEYVKHQHPNDSALPQLKHYSSHTASTTKPGFVDSVCTLEMPAKLLDAGAYTFKMSMQPDVFGGSRHVQSVQSNFVLVRHIEETSDGLGIGAVSGIAVGVGIILCIGGFVLGCFLGMRKNKREVPTKPDYHRDPDMDTKMDTVRNSGEDPDRTQRYKPMAFNNTTTTGMSHKEKQKSKQQQQQQQQQQQEQESDSDLGGVYVNQQELGLQNNPGPKPELPEDVYEQAISPLEESGTLNNNKKPHPYHNTGTGKSTGPKHDYHHPKSNKSRNTPQQQQQSSNLKKQQQNNPAFDFDPNEEYLEPAEARNILSGSTRPSNGMTAAGWGGGFHGSDEGGTEDDLYEPVSQQQVQDGDAGDDDVYLEPDQGKAIPVSDDTEIAMDDMYLNSEQARVYYNT